ncbi:MAG: hypothetical protein ABH986_02430 [archaeon]
MNQKGGLIMIILILFVIVAILPWVLMSIVPQAKILVQLILVFTLYTTVRGYLGSGPLTLIISGILIYILVIKYAAVSAGAFSLMIVVQIGVSSMLIWGTSFFMTKFGGRR